MSGGVWSAGTERALAVARRIRTGTVTINGSLISFDGAVRRLQSQRYRP